MHRVLPVSRNGLYQVSLWASEACNCSRKAGAFRAIFRSRALGRQLPAIITSHTACASPRAVATAATVAPTGIPDFAPRLASGAQSNDGGQSSKGSSSSSSSSDPGSRPQPAVQTYQYSPLHLEIEEFCRQVVPTAEERRKRNHLLDTLRSVVLKRFDPSRVSVQLFGSSANGLSLWDSDMDVVVVGVFEPDETTGVYEPRDKVQVAKALRDVAQALRKVLGANIDMLRVIGKARMPILKFRTKSSVPVDVSIADDMGVQVAEYVASQTRLYPQLRPLVLVLKAFLNDRKLNDVAVGGLGSYSLTNMVLAHLQEEIRSGEDVSDLGETLYSFFVRYGCEFDYECDAVSVANGGIVSKLDLGVDVTADRMRETSDGVPWQRRLLVDCPMTGRDISGGTFRIDLVHTAFSNAADDLEAAVRGGLKSKKAFAYLSALFNADKSLRRDAVKTPGKTASKKRPPVPGAATSKKSKKASGEPIRGADASASGPELADDYLDFSGDDDE